MTDRRGRLNVSPHGLPHTFASRLAMAGVDPRTIQELGGWPSLKTLGYVNVCTDLCTEDS